MKKRILTGDRPTGPLHLGHYVGSLKNRLELQHKYQTFIMIADVQALTDNFENPEKVHDNVLEVALDYLAIGIDPDITTIFIQSQIPEIAELTVFYMNLVTIGRLQQNPTLKSEIKEKGFENELPLGFLAYPVSQAADITFLNANLVPVGEDQLPMIEQTRDIVRKFNRLYGDTFVEPEAIVSSFSRLPGTDGKTKMSKSLGNAIYLGDSADTVARKVSKMYTDPQRIHGNEPGDVEHNPVFIYLDAFGTDTAKIAEFKSRYTAGTVGDVEVKNYLTEVLNTFLEPIRTKRAELAKDPEAIYAILQKGKKKAGLIARKTLKKVRAAMKIDYF